MMLAHRRWLAAGVLVVLAAACSDSSGPGRLSDPAAVAAELQSLNSTFATPVFESYSAVASLIAPTTIGVSTAGLVLEATRPDLPTAGTSGYLRSAERAKQLQRLIPLASTLSHGFLPDSVKGTTFEWDALSDSYVPTARTGADAQGVRFILYAIDPLTERPVEPVVEVGYLDLIDESTPSSLRLHLSVKGVGGTPTYVDYLATITAGAASVRASVSGSISNGQGAAANKALGFSVTIVATPGSVTQTASFSLNNPSISISLTITFTEANTGFDITVDFRYTRPGETIQLAGTLTFTEVAPDSFTVAVDAAVRVNGATYATIEGNLATAQWVKADGTALTPAEVDALDGLGEAVSDFLDFAEDLFDPIENIFGG